MRKNKTEQGKEGQERLRGLEGMAVAKGLTGKVRPGRRFAGGEGQLGKECTRGNSPRKGPGAAGT